jgi:AcrR family transcriptional regulator
LSRIVVALGVTVNTRCYNAVSMATTAREASRRPASPAARSRATALQLRKRELVRQEIARAAWVQFDTRGYEATTVDEIAREAAVSRRTFFRYFSSKEDVVVGTSDALAEDFLAAFASRPADEPPLLAIQRALRPVVESRLADASEARAIIRLLRESRTLRRAMLERHSRMEERLAVLLAERTRADPRKDPTPALMAFVTRALMDTAFNVWYDQRPRDVGGMVDDLFRRLGTITTPLRQEAMRGGPRPAATDASSPNRRRRVE